MAIPSPEPDETPAPAPQAAAPAASPDRMPPWIWRAVLLFWGGLAVLWVARGLVHALRGLFITLMVALFLSFAIEPAVNRLARRGWRRGSATGLVFVGVVVVTGLFFGVMGSLVVNQTQKFVDDAPSYVDDLQDWVNSRFDAEVDLSKLKQALEDPGKQLRGVSSDLTDKALDLSTRALGIIFQFFTVMLFAFYLVADGPRLRRTICSRLPPEHQRRVLAGWELAIEKTGGYLYSRALLAAISGASHWVALTILGVPYPLAIALWVGVVSQFIPVVGTYLAGVLAVLIALLNDPVDGLVMLIFVLLYQQLENYLFAPRITAHTLDIHPAVAFGTVIAGAAMLGPVGALLALPFAGVVQALMSTVGGQYDVVESRLTREPRRRRYRVLPWSRRPSPTHPTAGDPTEQP